MGGRQCWRLPMMINYMAPSLSCHFLYFLEQIGSPVCQKDVTATCKKKYYEGFGSHIDKEKHFPVPVEYPSSLVPRPSAGGGKAWYTLFAHAPKLPHHVPRCRRPRNLWHQEGVVERQCGRRDWRLQRKYRGSLLYTPCFLCTQCTLTVLVRGEFDL